MKIINLRNTSEITYGAHSFVHEILFNFFNALQEWVTRNLVSSSLPGGAASEKCPGIYYAFGRIFHRAFCFLLRPNLAGDARILI